MVLSRVFFQSFSAGGHREQFWHRQGRPLLDVVHPAFPLLPPNPPPSSPPSPKCLKDDFGEGVMACDRLESFACPTLELKVNMYYSLNDNLIDRFIFAEDY